MEIYILRHGIAVARGTRGYKNDADRPLTKEGIEKMREIAEALIELDMRFDLILSSPLTRARQTAEIVGKEIRRDVTITDSLAPDANPANLISEINDEKAQRVLLVGHEPDLSRLISVLISGATDAVIELKKGGMCKLTSEKLIFGKSATLNWLVTPKQLRSLL